MSKELIEITSLLRMRFVTNDTCHKAADRIEELERENNELAARIGKELNEENLALQADNARLREALGDTLYFLERHSNRWDGINGKHPNEVACAARSSLSSTPEQSLAEYRNKVIEECAERIDFNAPISAAVLRTMKEQP